MFPYGFKHGMWRDEDYGPSTKHHGSMKSRKKWRRLLHKEARNAAKRELNKEISNISA